ncbi:hypothetical protein RAS1_11670 [Phycisphaerae bacterium RAS1]|nr:hypothetical protein RAS1_11670 [Phycisphaerae bacterium RAS1]
MAICCIAGCAHRDRKCELPPAAPRVVVVAPVLNLSGAPDLDPLKATDILASELLSFPELTVIPVNLTLAVLATRGLSGVESPQHAYDLAREFSADATLVVAVTEYSPYDPPVVGLVAQWYDRADAAWAESLATEFAADTQLSAAPTLQVQRVFNASSDAVISEVKAFADARDGHGSPYGWKRFTQSQELFLRFTSWSLIRTMLSQQEIARRSAVTDERSR